MCQKVMFDLPRLCCTGRRRFVYPGKRVEITGKYADISKN